MTDPTPAATARDALLDHLERAAQGQYPLSPRSAYARTLDNLIALAAAEAPGRVAEAWHTPECGGNLVCCSCHLFRPTPEAPGRVAAEHRWEDCTAGQDCQQPQCNPDFVDAALETGVVERYVDAVDDLDLIVMQRVRSGRRMFWQVYSMRNTDSPRMAGEGETLHEAIYRAMPYLDAAPAPTPSEPVARCDDHHISDMLGYCPKCGKDHPEAAAPSEPVKDDTLFHTIDRAAGLPSERVCEHGLTSFADGTCAHTPGARDE